VGGDLLGLGLDLVQGLHDGCTADSQRARAVGAHAKGHATGVTVNHIDLIGRNTQTGGHHLSKRGFVALPVAV